MAIAVIFGQLFARCELRVRADSVNDRVSQELPQQPVWSRNSCGCPVVELQQAPKALAAPHLTDLADVLGRKEEEVLLPLVIPLAVEVVDVRTQRGP